MKTKVVEYHGRGLSFRDAIISDITFDYAGNIAAELQEEKYKSGTLRFKRCGKRAIPVIQYDGGTDDELCAAFQVEKDEHTFIEFDVNILAEAITLYMKSQGML